MTDVVDAAHFYKARGWNPVPLKPYQKIPKNNGWQRSVIEDTAIGNEFRGANLGVALGLSSGNLYDCDLDNATARRIAPAFLPKTPAIFGRTSAPASHWLYICPSTVALPRVEFTDVGPDGNDGEMILEFRGDGGHTMFPPSIHPEGETIQWIEGGDDAAPTVVAPDKLLYALGWTAATSMLIDHWPEWQGQHHRIALALSGGLARGGIRLENAVGLFKMIDVYARDGDARDLEAACRDTYYRIEKGENVFALSTLRELIGSKRVAKLAKWLQFKTSGRAYTLTDDGNALRFVDLFQTSLRYVPERQTWITWDSRRWRPDDQEANFAYAREIPAALDEAAAKIGDADDDLRKSIESWANASRSVTRLAAIPRIARTDERIQTPSDSLDADPFALNVENGTLNLLTGGLAQHKREDWITKIAPVAFDDNAVAPRWVDFLNQAFDGDTDVIRFVQKSIGYSLTGSAREQCFFLMIGPQGTGKTTFVETLSALMGDYGRNTDPATFSTNRNTGRAQPELVRLQGARFVTTSETEERERLAAALLKRLSGNTKITAADLYKAPLEYTPVMKIWIDTNYKPRIPAHDGGVWARLVMLPFEHQFRHTASDVKDYYKVLIATELPGILKWALDGCALWLAEGLQRPERIRAMVDDYRDESDPLVKFVSEACSVDEKLSCSASDLFRAYQEWCIKDNERPTNSREFKRRLEERGYKHAHTNKGSRWEGITPLESTPDFEPSFAQQFNPHARAYPQA